MAEAVSKDPGQPLAGIRILSMAEQWPGPYATMLLADLGADVILVERPGSGDPGRRFPGLFTALFRNKRSVVLDLKSTEGREDFLRLVDTADVVLEGFRPGVMARLKIGPEELKARKPSLSVASISSVGQTGPMVAVAGHDLSIQGVAGMVDVPLGKESEAPMPMLPLADISSAMFAAFGIVTALFRRERTGGVGTQVDVSMLDSLVSWMTPFIVPAMNGLPIRQLPPLDPAYGVFATKDGKQLTLSIAGEPHMWKELCELLGQGLEQYADWSEEELGLRRQEVLPVLRAALAKHDHDPLCEQLEKRHIAFGPVRKLSEVTGDPQVTARGMEVKVEGRSGAERHLLQPVQFDGASGKVSLSAPGLGEHNGEVLGALRSK